MTTMRQMVRRSSVAFRGFRSSLFDTQFLGATMFNQTLCKWGQLLADVSGSVSTDVMFGSDISPSGCEDRTPPTIGVDSFWCAEFCALDSSMPSQSPSQSPSSIPSLSTSPSQMPSAAPSTSPSQSPETASCGWFEWIFAFLLKLLSFGLIRSCGL